MQIVTSWTLIRGAADGHLDAREDFSRRYDAVVRAYLGARWRGTRLIDGIEDAAQEVFVDCFREGGALERVEPGRAGGFRAFLFGVVRRVAQRIETNHAREQRRRADVEFDASGIEARDASLSRVFDGAWARAVMRDAGELHETRARAAGAQAVRRVELLRSRFGEDIPIREIADRWGVDAAHVHHEYARARDEFKEALRSVVSQQERCSDDLLDREMHRVLELLREGPS